MPHRSIMGLSTALVASPRSLKLVLAFVFGLSTQIAAAQAPTATTAAGQPARAARPGIPEFPTDPKAWINSPPIQSSALKGKAAFLWYFEEGCPRCREKWPGLIAAAQKLSGEPIVFIAVSSGTQRGEMEAYAREVGLTWPLLLDTSRQFEAASRVGEISLRNISQVKLIKGNGNFQTGDWSEYEKSMQSALEGAAWRVDPKTVPAALQPTWRLVEFGNFTAAAPALKKAAASPAADVQAVALKMQEAVRTEITADVAAAKKVQESGEKWNAYQSYAAISDKFKGYELPAEVETVKAELLADDVVKEELAAKKALDQARRMAAADKSRNKSRAVAMLKKVAADRPNTEAGAEAKTILTGLGIK